MVDNIKRDIADLIILQLLSKKQQSIKELTMTIADQIQGDMSYVSPYRAIYKLTEDEYIVEEKKRKSLDGRRRQEFAITDKGHAHLKELVAAYKAFACAMNNMLE